MPFSFSQFYTQNKPGLNVSGNQNTQKLKVTDKPLFSDVAVKVKDKPDFGLPELKMAEPVKLPKLSVQSKPSFTELFKEIKVSGAKPIPSARTTFKSWQEADKRSLSQVAGDAFTDSVLQTGSAVQTYLSVGAKKIGKEQMSKALEEDSALTTALLKQRQGKRYAEFGGIPVEDPRKFSEKMKDPKFIVEGIGQGIPPIAFAITAGVPAVVTGAGTLAAGLTAYGATFLLEGGSAYQDAKEFGADDATAEKTSLIVGLINGVLEIIPITKFLDDFPAGGQIKRQITRRITKRILEQAAIEGSTESLQEITLNTVAQVYDENRKILQGVPESAFFGAILGGGMGGFGGTVTDPNVQEQTRKAIESQEGFAKIPGREKLGDIEDALFEREILREVLDADPAKGLSKYANKYGQLPEVVGEGGEFATRGDDIVTEMGFNDSEEARTAYEKYYNDRETERDLTAAINTLKSSRADRTKVVKAIRSEMSDRRRMVRSAQEFFGLTNGELRSITKNRPLETMGQSDFDNLLDRIAEESLIIQDRSLAKIDLMYTIYEKELRKVDNLRQAMDLPPISQMTIEDMKFFNEALQPFKQGDTFLSKRKLEVVDKTDLKGIKTMREARERLAKDTGATMADLQSIVVKPIDRFLGPQSLRQKNPLYKIMVDETVKNILDADYRYYQTEKKINDLVRKARKSTKRSAGDLIIPTDKKIFEWLEASDVVKDDLAKYMTSAELDAAKFIRQEYSDMRDVLIQQDVLEKYRSNYITHIRGGFLESVKEDGVVKAFKNMFEQYKVDQAVFNILDRTTGQILPLEKFFQYSMKRTGELKPTNNVAKAFLIYKKAFEKKQALDAIVPKLDIYVQVMTPEKLTPRGLEFDRSVKTFFNEWMNTQKGRRITLVAAQGGKIDWALRGIRAFTSILDLGLNIPIGIATNFGENIANIQVTGPKVYAKGVVRHNTRKGRKIVKQYENFTGRTPWSEMRDASKSLPDKLMTGLFGLFNDATVRANRIYLLGTMTDAEYQMGSISMERLTALKLEMARYRVIEGGKSIVGSTPEAGLFTQYKTWALPIMRSVVKNFQIIGQQVKNKNIDIHSRAFQETFRAGVLMGLVGVMAYSLGLDEAPDKDDSFTEEMAKKAIRDAMSIMGALDPKLLLSEPRTVSFMGDIGDALSMIIKQDNYKTKPGNKGVEKLKKTFTPRAVKTAVKALETDDIETSSGVKPSSGGVGLPKLPTLPKLPKLPKL